MVKRSRQESDLLPIENNQDSFITSSPSSTPLSDPEASAHETAKFIHIDVRDGEAHQLLEVMRCSLPPHHQTLSFTSFEQYEVHYNKTHLNRCSECRKNFPTAHFLDLHISENHDPVIEILQERGERTYACFVEDCDRKCSTPNKRRMHLIDKHMFPRDYDFYVVNSGIDQRSSMLRSGRHKRRNSAAQHKTDIEERARQRSSTLEKIEGCGDNSKVTPQTSNDEDDETGKTQKASITSEIPRSDLEMDGLVGAMSSLKFVPPSVRFGRGRGRGGFSRN